MFDLVCIGNVVADVIVRVFDAVPPKGSLVYNESITLQTGGCAMSSACAASALGAKTAIIAKIGRDSFGAYLTSMIDRYRVDRRGLVVSDTLPTSASVALVSGDAERTFLHSPGANAGLTLDDMDWELIGNSKIAFFTGMNLMKGFDGEPCAKAMERCRSMGKFTVLDVCHDPDGLWMQKVGVCLPHADLFMPNENEAANLTGKTTPEAMADELLFRGAKSVVIKLGPRGCYVRESEVLPGFRVPTYKINPINTTGAGDCFCAGFLFGIKEGLPYSECAKIACAAGAKCVASEGTAEGVPAYEHLRAFIDNTPTV